MDIRCKYCGEPWDADEVHCQWNPAKGNEGDYRPYKEASKRFQAYGCNAWDEASHPSPCSSAAIFSPAQLEGLGIALGMCGDDLDAYSGDGDHALEYMEGADDE